LRERNRFVFSGRPITQKELADVYGVHEKTIANWVRIAEREQRFTPLPRGHYPEAFTEEDKKALIVILTAQTDLTLEQLRDKMEKNCSLQTIHNTLIRLGWH
jgi:transposase